MNVQELINKLMEVQDKTLEVEMSYPTDDSIGYDQRGVEQVYVTDIPVQPLTYSLPKLKRPVVVIG